MREAAVFHRDLGYENLETVFGAAPDRNRFVGEVVTRGCFVGATYDKRER